MKASIALALLFSQAFLAFAVLAFSAPAQAKPAPIEAQVEAQATAISLDDSTINSGPSGTMLEAAYFSAAQPLATGRMFPCRLQLRMFDKSRLARSCN